MTVSVEEKRPKPPRILIYGPQGLGKSTFGSKAPNPVFIQTEDGLDAIDVPAFPLAKTWAEVKKYLTELCNEDHDYRSVVIDSLDWLEPLMWQHLIAERPTDEKGRPVKAIEDYGFGKGYVHVMDYWNEYIRAVNYLRSERNMMVIQTAHAQVKRFDNPETDAYDRYEIKLHKSAAAKIQEHSDMVLFTNYYVGVKKEDVGFNGERKRAIGNGDRILYTEERPAFLAKNRYGLPAEIPFDKNGDYWKVIAEHLPFYNQKKGEVNE